MGPLPKLNDLGHRVAYNRAFADLGLEWNWDEDIYRELLSVAGGKERLRYYLKRYHPERLSDASVSDLIIDIHCTKIEHFARTAPTMPLRPGLLRLVREANAAGTQGRDRNDGFETRRGGSIDPRSDIAGHDHADRGQ